MRTHAPAMLISGLFAVSVALAKPLQAAAYTAKGITNSTGLAYDDVYGVINDRAIMRTDSGSIDLVDSTGAVKRTTKSGSGWYINDVPEWFNPLESALSTINNGYITLSSTNTENGLFACGLAEADAGKDLLTLNKTTVDIAVSPDGSRYVVANYDLNTLTLSLYKGHSSTLLDTIDILVTFNGATVECDQ